MKHRLALALIVLAYLGVGVLYAIKTPDWQVPDEPAHYNYIRQLAEERHLPVLEPGDYNQNYLERLKSERFPPELSLEAVEYEDHQPPLYYLLATPVYLLFDGALTPLRLFSVIIGAGVVIVAYAVAVVAFPRHPHISLGTAAFVAFLPQHVAMMAGVNNDGLAELWTGLTLWMLLNWLTAGSKSLRWQVSLGVVMGLGLLTKTTSVPVVLAAAVAAWLVRPAWRRFGRAGVLVFGLALLIAVPWWLHNMSVYGGSDIYGLANHDAVVVGQPRTADWIRDKGLGDWLERGVTFTFQSFWGQFGWMGVLMPTWLYRALALGGGILVAGFLSWLWEARRASSGASRSAWLPDLEESSRPLVVLAATVVFVLLAYLYYNRTFVQHQGRYLFPALIPIALGVALSLAGLLHLLRFPDRLRPLAFAAPYLGLAVLDLYALWRFIVPALTA